MTDTNEEAPAGGFAQLLKTHRTNAGLSQNRLALLSGVAQSHISQMEKGTNEPTLPTIRALAGVLNVHPGALIAPDAPALTAASGPEVSGQVAHAIEAGQAAQRAGEVLHLPESVIQLAEAQAIGRAVTTEGRTK